MRNIHESIKQGTVGAELLRLAQPKHYRQQASYARHAATKAEANGGKYRGYTARQYLQQAAEAEAIANGTRPAGTTSEVR